MTTRNRACPATAGQRRFPPTCRPRDRRLDFDGPSSVRCFHSTGFLVTRHRESRQTVPVMEPPDTNYVTVGDADVAYQVVGDGPRDVLILSALGGHVDLIWQIPQGAKYLTEMSAFSRVLLMDRRGSGHPMPCR